MKIGSVLEALAIMMRQKMELGAEKLVIGNVAFTDSSAMENIQEKMVISLVNVEEEKTLRYGPTTTVIGQDNNGNPIITEHNPPVFINLYLIISSHRLNDDNFEKSLDELGQVISFFQQQYIFTKEELEAANPEILLDVDQLVFELYTLSFEQMNHLWGVLGGKYIPSVMYKVKVVPFKHIPDVPAPLIRTEEASFNGSE